jgi:hypothetical protein
MKALLLADAGNTQQAEASIQSAESKKGVELYADFHHTAYLLAFAYARLNRPQRAMDWLEHAARTGFPCYPFYEHSPELQSLRSDVRFIRFMAGIKNEWQHRKSTLAR